MDIVDHTTHAELPATISKVPDDARQRPGPADLPEEQGEHLDPAPDSIPPGSAVYADYIRDNLFRPVNWRWRHACALAASGRRLRPKRDDRDAVTVAKFLRSRARYRTDRGLNSLEQKYPGLIGACRLAEDESKLRWEVQARILARQTDVDIAAASGLPVATVGWFEKVFFSIRNDLDSRYWITSTVLGPRLPGSSGPADTGRVWAHFGYHGGPLVLEVVMAVMRGCAFPAWVAHNAPGDPRRYEARLRLSTRMAILAVTMATPAEVHALRRLYRELLHLDGVRPDKGDLRKLQLMLRRLASVSASPVPAEPGSLSHHPVDAAPEAGFSAGPMP